MPPTIVVLRGCDMPRSAATIYDSLKKVPPFPPVAAKLLNLLSDPAVDTGEVADLIASDATFTARLLQRVNSAEFALAAGVTDIRHAIALLGLDTTRKVILAHAAGAYAGGGLKTDAMRCCWRHTVATAVLADEIAAVCGDFTGVAFTAGIIHDIGRLGLLVAYPEEYERAIRDAAERSLDVLDFEEEVFGANHAQAGRILAEQWGLPSDMLLVAGRHHDPCEGAELSLLRIVHVACRLADVLGYEVVKPLVRCGVADVLAELPASGRGRLTSDPEAFSRRIERRIREFDGEESGPAPEETLALLAAASPEPDAGEATEAGKIKEAGQAKEGIVEATNPPATGGADSAGQPSARKLPRWVGIAAALLALAAAALWIVSRG
jgi:HD-like signal output (HDOD) protein